MLNFCDSESFSIKSTQFFLGKKKFFIGDFLSSNSIFSKRPFTTQNMESEMAMDLCIDEKDEERESEAQSVVRAKKRARGGGGAGGGERGGRRARLRPLD